MDEEVHTQDIITFVHDLRRGLKRLVLVTIGVIVLIWARNTAPSFMSNDSFEVSYLEGLLALPVKVAAVIISGLFIGLALAALLMVSKVIKERRRDLLATAAGFALLGFIPLVWLSSNRLNWQWGWQESIGPFLYSLAVTIWSFLLGLGITSALILVFISWVNWRGLLEAADRGS